MKLVNEAIKPKRVAVEPPARLDEHGPEERILGDGLGLLRRAP